MALAEIRKLIEEDSIPSLILLYGEESYLIECATDLVLKKVVPPESRDFNLTVVYGRDLRPAEIVEQAMTLPVFCSHRLIQIKHLHETTVDQLDALIPYVENPVPETILLMSAVKIDSRRKFFQILKQNGKIFEFKKIYDNQLPSHVREMAKIDGVSFTSDALKLFCKRVGPSLLEVRGELDKLISYLGDRDLIDESDVAAIVSDGRLESIFMLMDALGEGQADDAIRLLHKLMAEGQAPLMILAMINRHFRQLWKANYLLRHNVQQKELPRQIGISPYFLKGLLLQARRYNEQDFRKVFELLLQTDLALKSSGAVPQANLELLIITLARLGRQSKN